MSTLQETLKETSGIDVKELIESYAGKHTLRPELEQIAQGLEQKQAPSCDRRTNHKQLNK